MVGRGSAGVGPAGEDAETRPRGVRVVALTGRRRWEDERRPAGTMSVGWGSAESRETRASRRRPRVRRATTQRRRGARPPPSRGTVAGPARARRRGRGNGPPTLSRENAPPRELRRRRTRRAEGRRRGARARSTLSRSGGCERSRTARVHPSERRWGAEGPRSTPRLGLLSRPPCWGAQRWRGGVRAAGSLVPVAARATRISTRLRANQRAARRRGRAVVDGGVGPRGRHGDTRSRSRRSRSARRQWRRGEGCGLSR